MVQSNSHIEICLRLIEAKWQRGRREEWSSYDFERLNTDIFETTGVSLSISTLKRLFGKVSYPNLPSTHTLNTLARFAGYEDWNHFRQQHPLSTAESDTLTESDEPTAPAALAGPQTPAAPHPITTRRPLTRWWPLLLLPIAVLCYSLLSSKINGRPTPPPNQYSFSCNKIVSEGVPNSVVFHYKAPVAPTDSVFIAQSWDLQRKIAVPATGTDYSAIYYYPGFFQAKLLVDTQIVLTRDLMITSDGWLAVAEADPVPLYFKKEEITRKEGIEVDSATLSRYHLSLQPMAPKIRLFYMKDMSDLNDGDFNFETTLKTGFNQGSGVCQYVEVLIQCKEDVFMIPLAAKACIGNLNLYAAGSHASSNNADLSGFGCDLTQWTTLRVTSRKRQVSFWVNGRQAWSLSFPHAPAGIVGVQYRFTGVCAVKNARFTAGTLTIDLK